MPLSMLWWICLPGGIAYHLLRIVRQRLLAVETGMIDLNRSSLGVARDSRSRISGTAVICGGSIGGLLAARVCHDHFEHVLVIEPEAWLSTEEGRVLDYRAQKQARARIIQNDSIQATRAIFVEGLKVLFPTFAQECQNSGIMLAAAEWGTYFRTGAPRLPYSRYLGKLPETMWASRPATETLIRRLTLDDNMYPNITQVVGSVVSVDSEATGSITRVNVRKTDNGIQAIDAALVVDCTGPAQGGLKWLKEAGFDTPRVDDHNSFDDLKETFDPKVYYVSCHLEVHPSLAERLPVPGGLSNLKFGYLPDVQTETPVNIFSCFVVDTSSVFICCGSWGSSNLPRTLDDVRKTAQNVGS